mmetsp:Transcript_32810/g.52590  ORF Transcript_32810/g.52590 Transcript_32810/m.52590 type:complete len:232 (+) Transcript_32810:1307-2002(+)
MAAAAAAQWAARSTRARVSSPLPPPRTPARCLRHRNPRGRNLRASRRQAGRKVIACLRPRVTSRHPRQSPVGRRKSARATRTKARCLPPKLPPPRLLALPTRNPLSNTVGISGLKRGEQRTNKANARAAGVRMRASRPSVARSRLTRMKSPTCLTNTRARSNWQTPTRRRTSKRDLARQPRSAPGAIAATCRAEHGTQQLLWVVRCAGRDRRHMSRHRHPRAPPAARRTSR